MAMLTGFEPADVPGRSRRPRGLRARRRAGGLLLLLALAGCVQAERPRAFSAEGPAADPLSYFGGTQTSWGLLESRGGAPSKPFQVDGSGRMLADGSLVLDQAIHWSDGRTDRRTWTLKEQVKGRFVGTLSDASGPVRLEADGRLMHIRYPMKIAPGAEMEQWLYLQDDRRTVLNEATVRILGVQIARISEIIRRGAPTP